MNFEISDDLKNALLEHLIGSSHAGIALLGPDSKAVAANPALADIAGVAPDRLLGADFTDILAPSSAQGFMQAVSEAVQTGGSEARVCVIAASGLFKNCRVRMWYSSGRVLAVFELDEDTPTRLDGLTGLETAERFYEELTLELYRSNRYNRPLSVLKCEIINLQHIYEQHGPAVSQRLEALAGWRLKSNTRRSDIVARMSPGQFAVLLPETELPGALTTAEKLSQTLKSVKVESRAGDACPEVCFGAVAASEGASTDPRIILDNVDWALSAAKNSGAFSVEAAPAFALRQNG